MKIIYALEDYPKDAQSAAVTIGNFDGVHLGHQKVLQRVKESGGPAVAITFSNHPSEVLRPQDSVSYLCTLEHKIALLEEAGIDTLILLTFTKAFGEQTAKEFLEQLQVAIPFTHLILGHNATFGKGRQGDRAHVEVLAENVPFTVEYIDAYTTKSGAEVSSSKIRERIAAGDLKGTQELLGRPYSVRSRVVPGQGIGKEIGFSTANIDVSGLCLPPHGVYAVTVLFEGMRRPAIANLGTAPTVRDQSSPPLLEVHLLGYSGEPLTDQTLEVIFGSYLRPEKKFDSIEALKEQIEQDVVSLTKYRN